MLNFKTLLKNNFDYLLWTLKVILRKWEFEIQLETTSFCNAKCIFCPNSSLKRQKNTMTDEVFEKTLDEIKKSKINVSLFILHINGEPLLDKNIVLRIQRIRHDFPASRIRFTSNFSVATPQLTTELLNSGLNEITISLNSLNPDEYKKIMGGLDYNKTLDNINTLLELKEKYNSKLKINISMVVRADNADGVELFKKKWEENCNLRFIQLGQWVDKDLPENYIPKTNKIQCKILYKTISILSNGDYALCCFDSEGIIDKNIMTTPINNAFFSGVYKRIRKGHRIYGAINKECVNCSFN